MKEAIGRNQTHSSAVVRVNRGALAHRRIPVDWRLALVQRRSPMHKLGEGHHRASLGVIGRHRA